MVSHVRAKRRLAGSRMRPVIALVVDAIFPYHFGGREIRYFELTQRLADRATIHVYTMNWWRGPRTISDRGIRIMRYRAFTRCTIRNTGQSSRHFFSQ